jgi:hypothetical protein
MAHGSMESHYIWPVESMSHLILRPKLDVHRMYAHEQFVIHTVRNTTFQNNQCLKRVLTWSSRLRVSSFELVSRTKNRKIYLGLVPSYGGNRLTSSELILTNTCVTKGEQRARLVHM